MTKTEKDADLSPLGDMAKVAERPEAAILETVKNENATRDCWIPFESREFTSLCPVTGQPDFAPIRIEYAPAELCIDNTKSLESYLASYRSTRAFNEDIVNRILNHIVEACQPRCAIVHGEFAPRGGIGLIIDAEYPDRSRNPAPDSARYFRKNRAEK